MTTNLVKALSAKSTLRYAVGSANTTIECKVSDASLFPSTYPYYLVLASDDSARTEIVKVSARTNQAFTVTRGQLGTTAVAHPADDLLELTEVVLGNAVSSACIYVDPDGDDTLGTGDRESPVATITQAMSMATATRNIIIVNPGTYAEDVTWSDISGVELLPLIPGTTTIEAVTAFAISIDPAAASGTWSATIGVNLSHADGLVGLQVDNATVGKRINLYLKDVDIESETSTDHAIDVNRSGAAGDAIRIYATGHGNTIEGLVDYITESTDDRVRFWGYRLIGGVTITGNVVMEVCYVNCGILTSGESYGTGNVSNHFGCYNETDANPNVHTVVADDDETSN